MPVKTRASTVINHICGLCEFPEDSIMMEFIKQEQWNKLSDITMISLKDVDEFAV